MALQAWFVVLTALTLTYGSFAQSIIVQPPTAIFGMPVTIVLAGPIPTFSVDALGFALLNDEDNIPIATEFVPVSSPTKRLSFCSGNIIMNAFGRIATTTLGVPAAPTQLSNGTNPVTNASTVSLTNPFSVIKTTHLNLDVPTQTLAVVPGPSSSGALSQPSSSNAMTPVSSPTPTASSGPQSAVLVGSIVGGTLMVLIAIGTTFLVLRRRRYHPRELNSGAIVPYLRRGEVNEAVMAEPQLRREKDIGRGQPMSTEPRILSEQPRSDSSSSTADFPPAYHFLDTYKI
ncbi:hypothetical protein GYMLUDRAFT_994682 [Collybiopsis luxurians FD-317 M1]|nr:hypothetical protein GYMLUDRAFT_994682 [Collybiopsis luxurians FD-317 M1]